MNEVIEQIKRAEIIINKKTLDEKDILNLKMQLFVIASAGNRATDEELYEASDYTKKNAIDFANLSDSVIVKLLSHLFLGDN